jgi:outer membrane protein assembly factor BamD
MKKIIIYILLALFICGTTSCDPYQKLLKSNDLNLKLTKAKEFYNKEEYEKAIPLFEEVLATFRGTKNFEAVYYYYAWSQFGSENYLMAAYHFKYISDNFPSNENASECEYMSAYCYYLLSPEINLDQEETKKALDAMQVFINNHPDDSRVPKANEIITALREKMELKATRAADLYYNISSYINSYKASIIAYKGVLKDYPDTKNADYLNFSILKSSYEYALQSVPTKKEQIFNETITYYFNFIDKFATSKYAKQAQRIYDDSKSQLEKSKNNNNN